MFEFEILAKSAGWRTRVGKFKTPHGDLLTPELAFVATEGEIKSIPKEVLPTLPVNLIIVNTFHLSYSLSNRSGCPIHDYANFQKPIMSDSGGFQVFSLGFGKAHGVGKVTDIFPEENNRGFSRKTSTTDTGNPIKITEIGAEFLFNGRKLLLTPEKSIKLQQKIGADIIFAFDECTSPLNSYQYTKKAMERTHGWLKRCIKQTQISNLKSQNQNSKLKTDKKSEDTNLRATWEVRRNEHAHWSGANLVSSDLQQALFAIVQGGYFEDLRKQSAKFVSKCDVPGFGIGGSLGRFKEDVWKVLEWTVPYLPEEKPRHLLGIGQVRDILRQLSGELTFLTALSPPAKPAIRSFIQKRGE